MYKKTVLNANFNIWSKMSLFSFSSSRRSYKSCKSQHPQINSVKSIQQRAAHFVFNDYSQSGSASSMLEDLNWPLLREHCRVNDLKMFYKINPALVNIPLPSEMTPRFPNRELKHTRF